MSYWSDAINGPTLLLDTERAKANIQSMTDKAARNRVGFRPHFKTHQSAAIGSWFREAGVKAIMVSSVDMAVYFAANGWTDISIAFPVNIREIDRINRLAGDITLHLLVENPETLHFLDRHLQHPVNVWIKIDAGSHRAGIPAGDLSTIAHLAEMIRSPERLRLQGLLTHAGHTYHQPPDTVLRLHQDIINRMTDIQSYLQDKEFESIALSVGDTPSCSLADNFSAVDEIRPGNFVFYDLMQYRNGICAEEQVAIALACPVVAKYEERSELVLHGGAVHLSKDHIQTDDDTISFGSITFPTEKGWGPIQEGCYLRSLSQEHGIAKVTKEVFTQVDIGELLMVIPVHSCLTADLMKSYRTLSGTTIETMHTANPKV